LYRNNPVHVRMIFPLSGKEYECALDPSVSFRENLKVLYDLEKEELSHHIALNSETRVYEEKSRQNCDMDVSLKSLRVRDGMVFRVY